VSEPRCLQFDVRDFHWSSVVDGVLGTGVMHGQLLRYVRWMRYCKELHQPRSKYSARHQGNKVNGVDAVPKLLAEIARFTNEGDCMDGRMQCRLLHLFVLLQTLLKVGTPGLCPPDVILPNLVLG
jgi:hypothetical protein